MKWYVPRQKASPERIHATATLSKSTRAKSVPAAARESTKENAKAGNCVLSAQDHAQRSLSEILGDFEDERVITEEEIDQPQNAGVVLSKIQHISKLPTLTGIADRFRNLSASHTRDIIEIADLIHADPTLTSQLLKVSRSAFYGLQQDDLDIPSSVLLLGTERIQMIASLLSGQSFLSQWDLKFKWRLLWMHSYATALFAPKVASFFNLPTPPSLYTGALLHDIGKILLSYLYPSNYRAVLLNARQSDLGLRNIERAHFGIDHEEAGCVFAKLNHFPEEVQAIIRYHSDPLSTESFRVQVAIVRLANLSAQRFNLGFSGSMRGIHHNLTSLDAWKCLAEVSSANLEFIHEKEFDDYLEAQVPEIQQHIDAAFT